MAFSAAAEWLGQVAAGAPAAAVAAGVDGGGNRPGEKRKNDNAEHEEEGHCRRFVWWVVGGRPFVERARKSEGERDRRISDSNRDYGF